MSRKYLAAFITRGELDERHMFGACGGIRFDHPENRCRHGRGPRAAIRIAPHERRNVWHHAGYERRAPVFKSARNQLRVDLAKVILNNRRKRYFDRIDHVYGWISLEPKRSRQQQRGEKKVKRSEASHKREDGRQPVKHLNAKNPKHSSIRFVA